MKGFQCLLIQDASPIWLFFLAISSARFILPRPDGGNRVGIDSLTQHPNIGLTLEKLRNFTMLIMASRCSSMADGDPSVPSSGSLKINMTESLIQPERRSTTSAARSLLRTQIGFRLRRGNLRLLQPLGPLAHTNQGIRYNLRLHLHHLNVLRQLRRFLRILTFLEVMT